MIRSHWKKKSRQSYLQENNIDVDIAENTVMHLYMVKTKKQMQNNSLDLKLIKNRSLFIEVLQMFEYHSVYEKTHYTSSDQISKILRKLIWIHLK